MKRIVVIIVMLLSIAISSCNNNSVNFQDIKVTEFEYDGRTYLIFEKNFYKMGVVEKHETYGCDNN